ncbi:MAG: FKBP-type peptidyl-prolyl cis-trans isomerase [Planctomycetes bacterium]|nr:FKBP-type peptidyl-prolyl cis-trans isomerase [Planctomycetota bacterium]
MRRYALRPRQPSLLLLAAMFALSGCQNAGGTKEPAAGEGGDAAVAGEPPAATVAATSREEAKPDPDALPGPGVTVREIAEGSGPPARRGDLVGFLFTARHDGQAFKEVNNRALPAWIKLGDEQTPWLPGLARGLPGIKAGGKRAITVPPELGFGDQQVHQIPPQATLEFEVEAVAVTRFGDRTAEAEAWLRELEKKIAGEPKPDGQPADKPEAKPGETAPATTEKPADKPAEKPTAEAPAKPPFDAKMKEKSKVVYVDVAPGSGEEAREGDKVFVLLRGWLWEDDKEFEAVLDPGAPFRKDVGGMELGKFNHVRGLDRGIPTMKVGGRRLLKLSPALGYGSDGHGDKVPPNSTLLYEVLLLGVDRPPADAKPASPPPPPEPGDTGDFFGDG